MVDSDIADTTERLRRMGVATDAEQIRAYRIEQQAALALQRSLLPEQLPTIAGLDMAARFVPGHEFGVGGDWYDVFSLPSGWLGVVVGDVSGHGLQAAVVMGRIRSAARAYALICDDPAEALTLLDRKVHHFEAAKLATVLYAMIPPDRGCVHVSLAGHLRPVLARPGRPTVLAPLPVDPPLGVGLPQVHRRTTRIDFPPGAILVCYTDGLVERRERVIDDGLDALVAAVDCRRADEVCTSIMDTVGDMSPTDDTAVLAVRRV